MLMIMMIERRCEKEVYCCLLKGMDRTKSGTRIMAGRVVGSVRGVFEGFGIWLGV